MPLIENNFACANWDYFLMVTIYELPDVIRIWCGISNVSFQLILCLEICKWYVIATCADNFKF